MKESMLLNIARIVFVAGTLENRKNPFWIKKLNKIKKLFRRKILYSYSCLCANQYCGKRYLHDLITVIPEYAPLLKNRKYLSCIEKK